MPTTSDHPAPTESEGTAPPAAARVSEWPPLSERLPPAERSSADEILDRFLGWAADARLELYPAQEEAILEIAAERHVILATPTGSGKSIVALFVHFRALATGAASYYTSPTKALASEKFFDLCATFGATAVGMLTGDASINRQAPIVCCTAEVLANILLREGEAAAPPFITMDEFHFYTDAERGVAWQVPLLCAPRSQFLLMSATLGDVSAIARRLERDTRRGVAVVSSEQRPVPLDFAYRDTPIQETVSQLIAEGRSPVYVVSFTHEECADLAQGLTSVAAGTRPEREAIGRRIRDSDFATPFGATLRRLLGHGIAVHHAGLLPRYRLLVENLAQEGLLKVICGTDTLGVGVNIPIRTVLFAKLAKYDGERMRILSARDFRQIAGRAGRKGFDDRGSVVCQAPEETIERRRALRSAGTAGGRKGTGHRRVRSRRGAGAGGGASRRGKITWDENTFRRLIDRPSEPLTSRFRVTHGMILNLLQRPGASAATAAGAADAGRAPHRAGYGDLVDLIMRCHDDTPAKRGHLRRAAALFRSLRRAGIIEVRPSTSGGRVLVSPQLQEDFSLHETLSLYLVDAVLALDDRAPDYAPDVLSVTEAILEDPWQILVRQERKAKAALLALLKAQRVPYEERVARLASVTYPRPLADYIEATFDAFAARHPWVRHEDIRPKSIAREMYERLFTFHGYVRTYGLQRSEGVLLRYLSQAYKTLMQTVPRPAWNDEVHDIIAYLRGVIEEVDTSLVEAWERMLGIERLAAGEAQELDVAGRTPAYDLAESPADLAGRVRAEMRRFVHALALGDHEDALRHVRSDPQDPWDAARLDGALAGFYTAHAAISREPSAIQRDQTRLWQTDLRTWRVRQILPDCDGDADWCVAGEVDLRSETNPRWPLVRLREICPV